MAFSAIELTTISRSQDYTTIKQHEDSKPLIDQNHIGQQIQKDTMQRAREVRSSDNSDWHNKKPDAREKGSSEYHGDGGRNRRRRDDADSSVSGRPGGFDIKI